MEDCLMKAIENFSNNFWIDLNNDYLNCIACKMFPLKNYLQIFYKFSNEEIVEYTAKIESEVYENLKKETNKRSKDIYSIAVELFRKKFWFEKDKIQRNWNRLEDDEIDILFKKCKSELNEIFENFKLFKIIRNPLYCNNCYLFN